MLSFKCKMCGGEMAVETAHGRLPVAAFGGTPGIRDTFHAICLSDTPYAQDIRRYC